MAAELLWFDDDPRKRLEDKVLRAAVHFERKYGRPPNLCFVHPSTLNENGNNGNGDRGSLASVDGVEIRSGRGVLPDHLWLGMIERGSEPSALSR